MSKAIELTNLNFEDEVMNSDVPVLVDFWAPWCGPCKQMAPILDELADELREKVKIAKLNVDNPLHGEIAMGYNIQSIPNMKLIKNGEVVEEFVGFRPKDQLQAELEQLV